MEVLNLKDLSLEELMDLEALFRARSGDDYREDSYQFFKWADLVLEEIINRVKRQEDLWKI